MALIDTIKGIEQGLLRGTANAEALSQAMADLQSINLTGASQETIDAYNKATESVMKMRKALKEADEAGKQNLENLRKRLETVTDRTKKWAEQLVKAGGLTGKLAAGTLQASHAASELSKSGDIGRFIQQMTAGIPIVGALGFVIGETVSATIKAQDALKVINKTFIDAYASVGKFAEGMGVAATQSADLGQALSLYEQKTGLTREQTLGLVTALGKAGFAMDEMGIDEKTKKIKGFDESISGVAESFGAFSSAVAMARATGMDMSQVIDQMAFQSKMLGQSIEETTKTFAGLQVASERSKLSTQILLPIVREIQDQYKYLGIQSDDAALSVGRMAAAAKAAGLGPQAGAQLLGRAAGGMLGAGAGTHAFLGQQLGMGTGLGAMFAFRRQAGERPGDAAAGVAQAVQRIMGGRFVSQAEAMRPGNELLAGIRAGQEQLVMQLLGLNQLEASGFLDMTEKLKTLEAEGKGGTEEAKKLRKDADARMLSENNYRAQTLTAQQKMALLMEVLARTAGKILIAFVRGFAGKAAMGAEGAMKELFEGIEKGEGLDVLNKKVVAFSQSLERDVTPAAAKLGAKLGSMYNWLGGFGSLVAALGGYTFIRHIKELPKWFAWTKDHVVSLGSTLKSWGVALGEHKGAIAKWSLAVGGAAAIGWELGTLLKDSDLWGLLDKPISGYMDDFIDWLGLGGKAVGELAAAFNKEALESFKRIGKLGERSGFEGERGGEAAMEYIEKYGFAQLVRERGQGAADAAMEQVREYTALRVRQFQSDLEAQTAISQYGAEGMTALQAMFVAPSQKERDVAAQSAGIAQSAIIEANRRLERIEDSGKQFRSAKWEERRAGKHEDAWDIRRGGWLFASRGDVVVDASSLADVLGTGRRGDVINKVFERGAPELPTTRVTERRTPPVEHEVVIHLVGIEEKLGQMFDTRLHVNIEKGVVQVGKEGTSKLRHGAGGSSWR